MHWMKKSLTIIFFSVLMLALAWAPAARAAQAPLLPFDRTGDLYVLDSNHGHILRITPAGRVVIELNGEKVKALMGWDTWAGISRHRAMRSSLKLRRPTTTSCRPRTPRRRFLPSHV